MRHTLASQLLRNGVSLPVISETLGHKSTQTTMSYLRIDIDGLSVGTHQVNVKIAGDDETLTMKLLSSSKITINIERN